MSQTSGVAPGGLAYVAIRPDHHPRLGHTYWRNPGDMLGEADLGQMDPAVQGLERGRHGVARPPSALCRSAP